MQQRISMPPIRHGQFSISSELPALFLQVSFGLLTVLRRLIGRKFSDKDVQKDAKHFPFSVVQKDGKPTVNVDVQGSQKNFTPEEVSAMVLGKMKEVAEFLIATRGAK